MLIRHPKSPILTRSNIPEVNPFMVDVSSVFNPGAVKFNDKYILLLRVQNRGRETFIVKAESTDGVEFTVDNKMVDFKGIEKVKEKIYHIYDARITKIENSYYVMFAMDMDCGCQLGLAKTSDFENFEFLGIVSEGDVRNGVLFPEKVNGKYLRFERPNKVQLEGGPSSGGTIVLSESEDLMTWKHVKQVMSGRFHYWDENIGSGPAPVKTSEGWLHVYHGIALHFASSNIYQAGVALHDLNDPSIVLHRGKYNILEPRESYELTGQVPNVVFPSGMIVENYNSDGFAELDSKVSIYYGAADTVVGLATTTIIDLIKAAKQ
ncbi:MAG: glycoside hydrolase family 130 protein [Bacteroidetes bacterium]|nr:glycoside hydrolase family 130 protein [Bacteroidota bacterium]MBU1116439.1 glycoside hydrolase family 130 protein [Bacteroidota bacterium]MBU1800018.1 glycoside hydrolase family 130 protein [Bacteroidota bacterium]